jgi:hypothetical protein
MIIRINKELDINVSNGKENYSQRNNELDPFGSCNVTSMCMALDYIGYSFPTGQYKQPEDNLYQFMKDHNLEPTVHAELSIGVNKWIRKDNATNFSVHRSIDQVFGEIREGRPVVLSGTFPGFPKVMPKPYGHVVCLVGGIWQDDLGRGLPDQIIIDDPFGNTLNNWNGSGNDIHLSQRQFIDWIKDCGSPVKWGHFFVKP